MEWNWELFWNAVGAIATSAAVIVALWQSRFSYRKKLKLSINENVIFYLKSIGVKKYIGLTVANVGNRNIELQKWGYYLSNGTEVIIMPEKMLVEEELQPELPYQLCVEKGVTMYYDKALFIGIINDCITQGQVSMNKKIRFYIEDSTGKKQFILTNKTISELLTMREEMSNTIYS